MLPMLEAVKFKPSRKSLARPFEPLKARASYNPQLPISEMPKILTRASSPRACEKPGVEVSGPLVLDPSGGFLSASPV